MVRAIKLELTPSGTYYNASQGAFITVTGVTRTQLAPVYVDSITRVPSGIMLTWTSVPGGTYRVAFIGNLADTNWANVNPDISADGQTISWTDPTAQAASQRFYRVFEIR